MTQGPGPSAAGSVVNPGRSTTRGRTPVATTTSWKSCSSWALGRVPRRTPTPAANKRIRHEVSACVVLLAGDARGQPQLPAELLGGLEQGDHVPALGGADRGLQPGRSGADDGDLAAPTLEHGAEHQLGLVTGTGIDQAAGALALEGQIGRAS